MNGKISLTYPDAISEGILNDQLRVRVIVSDANCLPSQPDSEILNQLRLAASTPLHPLAGQAAMYSRTGPEKSVLLGNSKGWYAPRCPQSHSSQLAVTVLPASTSQVNTLDGAERPPQATIGLQ